MRTLPIPGRYLEDIIRATNLDTDALEAPLYCRDRWNNFAVKIGRIDCTIKKHIYFQGYFEWAESNFIRSFLKPGNTFVDVGANIGWHTLIAANKVGAKGRVLSFEPVTTTFNELEDNIEINGFKNISPFRLALSDTEGSAVIYGNVENDSGGNSMITSEGRPVLETISMQRGDVVLAGERVTGIDLLKIDVEGAEMRVLEGLAGYFERGLIGAMLVEINSPHLRNAGTTPEAVVDYIRQKGFVVHDVHDLGSELGSLKSGDYVMNVVCRRKISA